MPYVADTHSLVWYFTGSSRLSVKALDIFRKSAAGEEIIVIPTIVLGEILYISESTKVAVSFTDILKQIESSDNFEIAGLDLPTLKVASEIKAKLEMYERFIIATAKIFDIPLITKDSAITRLALWMLSGRYKEEIKIERENYHTLRIIASFAQGRKPKSKM